MSSPHFYRSDFNIRAGGSVVAGPFETVRAANEACHRMNAITGEYVPQYIRVYDGQYAIFHGQGRMTCKPTLCEAIQLCQAWKNRGLCTSGDIDNLFLNNAIPGCSPVSTIQTIQKIMGK